MFNTTVSKKLCQLPQTGTFSLGKMWCIILPYLFLLQSVKQIYEVQCGSFLKAFIVLHDPCHTQ